MDMGGIVLHGNEKEEERKDEEGVGDDEISMGNLNGMTIIKNKMNVASKISLSLLHVSFSFGKFVDKPTGYYDWVAFYFVTWYFSLWIMINQVEGCCDPTSMDSYSIRKMHKVNLHTETILS